MSGVCPACHHPRLDHIDRPAGQGCVQCACGLRYHPTPHDWMPALIRELSARTAEFARLLLAAWNTGTLPEDLSREIGAALDAERAREETMQPGDKMVYLDGSRTAFRCTCGCNVFRKPVGAPNKYVCNSCKARYTGE